MPASADCVASRSDDAGSIRQVAPGVLHFPREGAQGQCRFPVWAILAAFLSAVSADSDPFSRFSLAAKWQDRFWSDPAVRAIADLDPRKIAELVPVQAGLKFCRCPKVWGLRTRDPLSWSIAKPERLTCRKCATVFPDDKFPAKIGDKIPEDAVEVSPRRFHHYPYHLVEAEKAVYPDERIYLAAKRDDEAREFLAKLALYSAVKWRDQPAESRDPKLSRLACVLILRFAQVYPDYATHFDRPGAPKSLDRADLKPPFRRGYGTAKWDSSGCLDVPLNLVIAYALVKDDPALSEAGKALDDANPRRTIERDLFRASAEFVRLQPEEYVESSLMAYRGMLAVGRLLDDRPLIREASIRVDEFLGRGFYHDGLWKQGDGPAHRRIVGQLDGWIARLLALDAKRTSTPLLGMAREADRATWIDARANDSEILLASWPATMRNTDPRRPALLGGANLARLGIGSGDEALDLELRGLGDHGGVPSGRLSLRIAVGGRPLLGDLDHESPTPWGFESASASRSGLVMVDGLNQRETIDSLRQPGPGADLVFFAADRDFQVVRLADRFAYPKSTTLYRHTAIAVAGPKTRYAVSIVEVHGGLQHDQVFHGPIDAKDWHLSVATTRGPQTLLPVGMPFLPTARVEDGRWFVQAMGAFRDLNLAPLDRPAQADLKPERGGVGLRLHLLNDVPLSAFLARSPAGVGGERPSLIVRRRSEQGESLNSAFVTLFEPIGSAAPLRRVGRVKSDDGVIVLAIETIEGTEYLAVNSNPGEVRDVTLPDGRALRFDGLAVRVATAGPILAGGTFAEVDERRVALETIRGHVVAAGRSDKPGARGVFRVSDALANPGEVAGRTLIIRHGDGSSRGWTIVSAENLDEGGARLHVFEEAGLRIDPESAIGHYERFPGGIVPGPHAFGVSRIAR